MLATGEGGPEDRPAAISAFDRGCTRRDPEACARLAWCYETGWTVSVSPAVAIALAERACRLGHQPTCESLKAANLDH